MAKQAQDKAAGDSFDVSQIAGHKYLQNGKYSDLTVTCRGLDFAVHRCYLAAHSPWFERLLDSQFKEATTRLIELNDDDPRAIENMIEFIYTRDYGVAVSASGQTGALLNVDVHAAVYCIADKYEVEGLQTLAMKKFARKVLAYDDVHGEIVDAVRLVYNNMPILETQNELRPLLQDIWLSRGWNLAPTACGRLPDLVRDVPEFAVDLLQRLVLGTQPGFVKSCGEVICFGAAYEADLVTEFPFDCEKTKCTKCRSGCVTELKTGSFAQLETLQRLNLRKR